MSRNETRPVVGPGGPQKSRPWQQRGDVAIVAPPAGNPGLSRNGVAESTLAAYALWYARQGWPVFPLRHSKAPFAGTHGHLDASTDAGQVATWWRRWPRASIGAPCGPVAVVLDVDGPAGRASLAGLLTDYGQPLDLPDGWVASSTGRLDGGVHYWFAAGGPNRRPGFRKGLDWLGRGGFVVLPPSFHGSGRRYAWRDGRPPSVLPPAPEWLTFAAKPPPPKPAPVSRSAPDRIAGLARHVAGQREGNRNAALFWAACRAVEESADPEPLVLAAVDGGLPEREARRTIASAYRAAGGAS